ncbi:fasciclin domain-containing protein [Nocardioides sp. SYSU D00038]|uniref:fasciclin domain-containing protein n=1 Tax=Nocardioides sp. SYSU D00038 TaxID=2812554 RepID=UPI0019680487|nr:fasciclin domain-containing protein [Nocardioides sp. SYSU D00038]
MKRTTLRRSGAAAAVLALSMGLAACSDEGSDNDAASDTSSETSETTPSEEPTTEEPMTDDAAAQTFGDGCASIPTEGKGSFNGMVTDPVATAASNNPLLKTLVTAVGAVPGLADTLNGAEALTVFAPIDDAFAAVPKDTLDGLLADPDMLGKVLSHHVVAGQLDPTAVVGEQQTLNNDSITIEGDAESGMTVNGANVLCGNIPTKNATVYVIDQVLVP